MGTISIDYVCLHCCTLSCSPVQIIQVLERMYEVEAVTEPDTETKRPEEHLLVSRHLPDVVPPEVYLGNDVEFVDFIQGRANVRLVIV